MAELVFFSEDKIELNNEVRHHPDLVEMLANHPADEFEMKLAEIAAYVGIQVDGEFWPEDLEQLIRLCLRRLKSKRYHSL